MNVASEYAKQLKNYMKRFGLQNVDVAYLAKTNREVVSGILKGEKGAVLKTLEAISNIFGLRYFEFGNPNNSIPSFDSLPEKTKQRIAYRKAEGDPKAVTYTPSDINHQISKVIKNYKIGDEFLAEDVANSILEEDGETYSVSQIIDRFKKSFKGEIEKTERKDTTRIGRGPKPVFYKLKKK